MISDDHADGCGAEFLETWAHLILKLLSFFHHTAVIYEGDTEYYDCATSAWL